MGFAFTFLALLIGWLVSCVCETIEDSRSDKIAAVSNRLADRATAQSLGSDSGVSFQQVERPQKKQQDQGVVLESEKVPTAHVGRNNLRRPSIALARATESQGTKEHTVKEEVVGVEGNVPSNTIEKVLISDVITSIEIPKVFTIRSKIPAEAVNNNDQLLSTEQKQEPLTTDISSTGLDSPVSTQVLSVEEKSIENNQSGPPTAGEKVDEIETQQTQKPKTDFGSPVPKTIAERRRLRVAVLEKQLSNGTRVGRDGKLRRLVKGRMVPTKWFDFNHFDKTKALKANKQSKKKGIKEVNGVGKRIPVVRPPTAAIKQKRMYEV